jgi:hypothetical protein
MSDQDARLAAFVGDVRRDVEAIKAGIEASPDSGAATGRSAFDRVLSAVASQTAKVDALSRRVDELVHAVASTHITAAVESQIQGLQALRDQIEVLARAVAATPDANQIAAIAQPGVQQLRGLLQSIDVGAINQIATRIESVVWTVQADHDEVVRLGRMIDRIAMYLDPSIVSTVRAASPQRPQAGT